VGEIIKKAGAKQWLPRLKELLPRGWLSWSIRQMKRGTARYTRV